MGEHVVPVTCLTGFLGSGKTTLLNRIMSDDKLKLKIGVIINEFGAIGIDDKLVRIVKSEEEIVELNNGCVCCSVRGDLIKGLHKLLLSENTEQHFDLIIIETTGLADPGPVIQTLYMDEELKEVSRMDGVICCIDTVHVIQALDRPRSKGAVNETVQQIAFADKIIMNKLDLVKSEEEISNVEKRIRSINPFAEIFHANHSDINLDKVLNIKSFDLNRILDVAPSFLVQNADDEHTTSTLSHADEQHGHGHVHTAECKHHHPPKKTKFHHDDGIMSVGFERDGVCDIVKLNAFFDFMLKTYGSKLFRYKGVLTVDGLDQPFVFSGVHMHIESSPKGNFVEQSSKGKNYLVFIGIELDQENLMKEFEKCLQK